MGRLSPVWEEQSPEQSVTCKTSHLSEIREHSSPDPDQALELTPLRAATCAVPSAEALLIQNGLSHHCHSDLIIKPTPKQGVKSDTRVTATDELASLCICLNSCFSGEQHHH